jgi:hypothetical protein
LYSGIARREGDAGEGIIIISKPAAHASTDGLDSETEEDLNDNGQRQETESCDVPPTT